MAPSPGKGPSQVKALVASAGASLSGALSKVVGSSKKCKAAGEAPGHLQSRDGRRSLLDCLEAMFVGRGVAKAEIGDLLLELGRDFNEDRLGREPGDDGAAAAEEARRTKSKNEMNLPPELVAFTPLREHPLVAAARAEMRFFHARPRVETLFDRARNPTRRPGAPRPDDDADADGDGPLPAAPAKLAPLSPRAAKTRGRGPRPKRGARLR